MVRQPFSAILGLVTLAIVSLLLALAPPPQIIAVPSPPPEVLVPPPVQILSPPPTPHSLRIIWPPQPRRPAQDNFAHKDYPAAALRAGAQGRVAFSLDVGPDGRVFGCTITRSSESAVLDSATCSIMRRRGRFIPAIDSSGNPAPGTVSQEIEWTLPPPTERG